MKKEIKTFDDYMADETRVTASEREQILFEASLIGKMIEARESRGITQRELARLSGIMQPAIARLESMRTAPQIDTVLRILEPLGYTLEIVAIKKENQANA